jgi:hypothetical protein
VFERLALLCALAVLAWASVRTDPLLVSEAQVSATATATSTSTATGSTTPATPASVTATPTATTTATATPSVAVTATPPPPTAAASASPSVTSTPVGAGSTAPTGAATTTVTPSAPTATTAAVSSATAIATWTATRTATATSTASATPTRTVTVTLTPTPPKPTVTTIPTITLSPTMTPTPVAPQIQAVAVSSLTRSGATLTWTTDAPSTSQVEFGTSALDVSRSPVDGSLVTVHRSVVTGLQAGTTYRYRVSSLSASGGLGISAEGSFVTTPLGSGPEVNGLTARRLTSTTAMLSWSTGSGTVAHVEYGATANYGQFTLLKAFALPAQEVLLTGLQPATEYHFRVKAWDALGFLGASDDATFTTAANGRATLLGTQTLQPESVSLAPGQAAAYQYVAAQSGQASVVRLFVDSGTAATVIRVALYSDASGVPGALLSQGSAPGLVAGWTSVALPPVALAGGSRYWIVVLSPLGGGTLNLRDAGRGGSSLLSSQTTLAALPVTWSAGALTARAPLAAYVQQMPPAVTLLSPAEGAVVTGKTSLSAVVDDDVPLVRVQFLVDGLPVGGPLASAPFSVVWDSTGLNPNLPHTIAVRATDVQGRTGVSGLVTVQVDNGPTITDVAVSRGLTTTSVRITWTTDLPADGQVEYGPTAQYGAMTPLDPRAGRLHEAQLTGLADGLTYHYRVLSRDANGAVGVSQDGTFFTPEL